MQSNIHDQRLVEKWLTGWSLSRHSPLPVKNGAAFRVDVGWPQQKTRYVFPRFVDEFIHLAHTITEPWVFLKVCAAPEVISSRMPSQWVIQPPGFLMTCSLPMSAKNIGLPDGYLLAMKEEAPAFIVKILTIEGDTAATGRLVFVDDIVVYDRIETVPEHRRKGLATIVLLALENLALSRGITTGVLVATEAGKALYETLGWEVYSLYTSVVIPGREESGNSLG
ncbi:GNAT family N-acetyltransferase [Chitinophaga nivalis]|uniref:GNAT family N-acetyltransferase n=1 Tax=Chitinophaga nivalis TaxID=2991709 RepID=A0ABT3II86_9BACT|nr:GNAT family N-acetyltransferase [Chitinophaga nivalis]MCW3466626.1 GNAT family N-acetyltransferase [Chitinophaga nivalis]MCW3483683.1 GNAT family N-acetyltransferase [Chitinophaga nivalis]